MTVGKSTWLRVLALSVLAFALSSCGGGGGSGQVIKPKVRFLNASPDSNGVDYTFDLDVRGTDVQFLQLQPAVGANPAFVEIDPKNYDVLTSDHSTAEQLDAQALNVTANNSFLFASFGLRNYGLEPLKRFRTVMLPLDMTAPNGNKAKLFVFHGFMRASGFETPQIDFQNPGDNPQYRITGIDFGASNTITVDSGNALTFQVRRSGTEQVYIETTPNLDAGGIYFVLITGIEGGSGAQAPSIDYLKLN